MARLKGGGATLHDVARHAKVSFTTASRVVNGRFGKMTQDTRDRVEVAIAELNYRPSARARALRLEKTAIIGMLVVDPASSFLANPFIAQIVGGVSNAVGQAGYDCLLRGVHPRDFASVSFLRVVQTDGLCVFLYGDNNARGEMMQQLLALQQPVVAIEEPQPPTGDFAVVSSDNHGAGIKLMSRLIAMGARSFVVMTPDVLWPAISARLTGLDEQLQQASTPHKMTVLRCGDGSVSGARAALAAYLENNEMPEALIGGTHRLSIAAGGLLKEAAEQGSIILGGFSGIDYLEPPDPAMVTVFSSPYELGFRAGKMLVKRLSEGAFPSSHEVLPWA